MTNCVKVLLYFAYMKTKLYYYLRFFRRSFAAGVVVVIFTFKISAQHWVQPSSRWEYITYVSGLAGPGFYVHGPMARVSGDTAIAGVPCHRIIITGNSWVQANSEYYTYEWGDTAFLYVAGAFRPYMYFNVNPGDTVGLYRDTTGYSAYDSRTEIHAIVASIDSVTGLSGMLRRYTLQMVDSGFESLGDYVYAEKLGILHQYNGFFYPSYDRNPDGITVSVCNYGDSTLSHYLFYPDSVCDINTGINDLSQTKYTLRCFPNPSPGTFTIDMSGLGSGVKEVHIYDQLGQVIYTAETDRSELALDLHLAGGMYEVKVLENKRFARGKILIE